MKIEIAQPLNVEVAEEKFELFSLTFDEIAFLCGLITMEEYENRVEGIFHDNPPRTRISRVTFINIAQELILDEGFINLPKDKSWLAGELNKKTESEINGFFGNQYVLYITTDEQMLEMKGDYKLKNSKRRNIFRNTRWLFLK